MRWGRIIAAGLAAFLTGMLLTVLLVAAYGLKLGFEARGAPDQARIDAFAERVAPVAGPALLVIMTMLAAYGVTRNVPSPALHGLLIGVVATVFALLLSWPPDLADAGVFALVVGAAWSVGAVRARRQSS